MVSHGLGPVPRQVVPEEHVFLEQQLPHSEAPGVVQHAIPRHATNLAPTKESLAKQCLCRRGAEHRSAKLS
jgi:hypothetical protein